ncbi:hypothetical protein [Streptomyces sp. NBC_00470]|uniref:hypothetical protein n=1 Tax=Streptomyces sp. NBC_00470 TaxID=2975753 RepID=UPI002F9155F0
MLTPPPDTYPGCTWADHAIPAPAADAALGHIGTASVVEPRTGLTTRYTVTAYHPHARTLTVVPDIREDRSGVARAFPAAEREARTLLLDAVDDVRLVHQRPRDDLTALHAGSWCRHVVKAAFTAGGDKGVPLHRRTYRFYLRTTERTCRFLVHAPSEQRAEAFARRWWQGTPTTDGWRGGRLEDGERIEGLTCEGARDMPVWPHPEPIADPL